MIFTQLSQQLTALIKLLHALNDKQYNQKIEHLASASIGGHTRHIIELIQCIISGHNSGEIDYVNRTRNLELEKNKLTAIEALEFLAKSIKLEDKELRLTIDKLEYCEIQEVFTTYFREIVYNAEHTIHHLALIRVALIEMKLNLADKNFGLAYATIKYNEKMDAIKQLA